MPVKAVINGLDVDIEGSKVTIHDVLGNLSRDEAVTILKYLHSEGFLDVDHVFVEIVTEEEGEEE